MASIVSALAEAFCCYLPAMPRLIAIVGFALLTACAGHRPPTAVASGCAAVACADETRCEETHHVARCVPIMRPHPSFCGGIASLPCRDGGRCVDDPGDDCDPSRGGRDCGGVCVPETAPSGVRP